MHEISNTHGIILKELSLIMLHKEFVLKLFSRAT